MQLGSAFRGCSSAGEVQSKIEQSLEIPDTSDCGRENSNLSAVDISSRPATFVAIPSFQTCGFGTHSTSYGDPRKATEYNHSTQTVRKIPLRFNEVGIPSLPILILLRLSFSHRETLQQIYSIQPRVDDPTTRISFHRRVCTFLGSKYGEKQPFPLCSNSSGSF